MTSLKFVVIVSSNTADNFENFDGFIAGWANEDISASLVEAVDQYENEKTEPKEKKYTKSWKIDSRSSLLCSRTCRIILGIYNNK